MAVAIVADSTCDLSRSEAAGLGVDLVPIIVRFGDKEYHDGVDLLLTDFYIKLDPNGELPVTSPPPESDFEAAFKRHVDAGREVIAPIVSAKLSKTYERAMAAAAKFPGKVHVVDTKTLSAGVGLIVTGAAKLVREGRNAQEILDTMNRWIASQLGYATYPDLRFLAKSGRISKAQMILGTMMHLYPIVRLDKTGGLEGETTVKSFELAREMIVDIMIRKLEHPERARITIVHAHDQALADHVDTELRKKLKVVPRSLTIHEAGPSIASNGGPGLVAIFSLDE